MSRTFAYARVSTSGQTLENQLGETEATGLTIAPHRIVTETISGSVTAQECPIYWRTLHPRMGAHPPNRRIQVAAKVIEKSQRRILHSPAQT